MSKQELIDFLTECEKIGEQKVSIEKELKEIEAKINPAFKSVDDPIAKSVIKNSVFVKLMPVLIGVTILGVISCIVAGNMTVGISIFPLILFCYIVPSVISIPFTIKSVECSKTDSIIARAKYADMERKLWEVQEKETTLLAQAAKCATKMELHPDYFPYAGNLIEYLKKGRADTLKEAINLLEQDIAEAERNQREEEYRRKIQESAEMQENALRDIARQTRKTAAATENTARWSMISAVLAAHKLEEDRRRDDD